jgi:hypothetical protein
MKRVAFALSILLAIAAQSAAADNSAGKIIDRYRKAAGGGALKKIKSTLMTGRIKTAATEEGRFSSLSSAPEMLRVDIEAGDLKTTECYNGKSAWAKDGRGLRSLLGDDAKRLRLRAQLVNTRLGDLKRNRIIARLAGKATIDGREAIAVEFAKGEARVRLLFDAANNLIVRLESESAEGTEEISYGDYRAVDGVMEPFSIRIKKGAIEHAVTIERVEHNRAVDVTAFHYPKVEGARPLPDLTSLMKAINANQEKVEQMRERYTCRMAQVERKHEGDGRVKESETRLYEVTPVGREFVERLISENGRELSPSEQQKEDRRIQKEIEEILKRQKKEKEKEERARARGEEADEDGNRLTILHFLRISEVSSIRREIFRGHEVLAFDFEPRKGFKPRSRAESIASKLAGTVWVDEGALQIVRLEARLTDTFKVGGGLLASVAPSTAFVFEQDKIGEEVWLPSFMEANLSIRLMLFAKLNRSMTRQYSDYRKYHIDSNYDAGKPPEEKKPEDRF